MDQVDGYECRCVAGFGGDDCETPVDECTSQPCENQGVCTDLVNGYVCDCLDGFAGDNCEIGEEW